MAWKFPKTTVITGAASGIGRALAIEVARNGFKVGVADIDMEGAKKTLAMVEKAGGTGDTFRCDVRNAEDVQKMADYFFDTWGEVGLLVNNAGLMAAGSVEDIPLVEWKRVIDTDLWGPIHGCRTFLPKMKANNCGHILITASMSGVTPPVEEAPYNVAKAGAISLGETLKIELAPFNIGVTILIPMGVNTNVVKNSYTNPEVEKLWEISFASTRQTPEMVAKKTIRAVQKNRLYLYPHFHGKVFAYQKNVFPRTFFRQMAFLHRKGWLKPWLAQMARRGWL
jgi:NAD(P)-dependent dehydrogenase (short-subunit alcohol dehydrogenase family)